MDITDRYASYRFPLTQKYDPNTEIATRWIWRSPSTDEDTSRLAHDLAWRGAPWPGPISRNAFVTHDPHSSDTVLARGPSCPRPLFFSINTFSVRVFSHLAEASRYFPINHALMVRRAHSYLPVDGETVFKGVRMLRLGEVVRIKSRDGALCIETLNAAHLPKRKPPMILPARKARQVDDILERAEEHILTATKACVTKNDGPVAVTLSGGLDSAIIAGALAKSLGSQRHIHAYTVATDPEKNEVPLPLGGHPNAIAHEFDDAARVARQLPNISHHRVSMSSRSLPATLWRIIQAQADIPTAPGACWWMDAVQINAKKHDCPVILSGQFGNETLSPAGLRQIGFAPLNMPLSARLAVNRALAHEHGLSAVSALLRQQVLPQLKRTLASTTKTARLQMEKSVVTSPYTDQTIKDAKVRETLEHSLREQKSLLAIKTTLFASAVERLAIRSTIDEALGYASFAYPFADHAVREFAWSLPVDVFAREGQSRWLARQLYTRIVGIEPPAIVVRGSQAGEWHHMFVRDRNHYCEILGAADELPMCRQLLRIAYLQSLTKTIPDDRHALTRSHFLQYNTLLRGLSVAIFCLLYGSAQSADTAKKLRDQLDVA